MFKENFEGAYDPYLLYKLFDAGKLKSQIDGEWFTSYFVTMFERTLFSLGYKDFSISRSAVKSAYIPVFRFYGYEFHEDIGEHAFHIGDLTHQIYCEISKHKVVVLNDIDIPCKRSIHSVVETYPTKSMAFLHCAQLAHSYLSTNEKVFERLDSHMITEDFVEDASNSFFKNEAKDNYISLLEQQFQIKFAK